MLVAAIMLLIVGYVGLLCGRLIKSAISRQREYLADAQAVQFTRNPGALCGVLAAIGGAHAEKLSHMYFAESIKVWLPGHGRASHLRGAPDERPACRDRCGARHAGRCT